ncbi:MAG TPA: NAD(P)H-hydrate epimerase, partial [Verrucomicrobiae bacterium]|nr:NAD(P)H-hydrate epimerase [Verrucomicrobiae bacterium]
MRILTAESMAAVDRRAIAGGIPGLTLMENAGKGAAGAILRGFPDARSAVILCGQGNNGGDGYVAARHLQTAGWRVQVFVLAVPGSVRGDALHNLELLDPGCVQYCTSRAEMQRIGEELSAADLGVDAIFGTGLRKPVEGVQREAVQALNTCGKPVVALDIPSGVEASSGRILGCAVRADLTVTFAAAKVGHLLYPGAEQTGELRVLDIGIPPYMLEEAEGYEFLDLAAAARLLRRRRRTDHKGTFGHCLLLAGAPGTTGAASMSANSAVRAGAGLVTVAVPQGVHAVLEVKTTEAMTVPLPEAEGGLAAEAWPSVCALLAGKSAVVVGPGLGRRAGTAELVRRVVRG